MGVCSRIGLTKLFLITTFIFNYFKDAYLLPFNVGHSEKTQKDLTILTNSGLSYSKVPLCINNLLTENSYNYTNYAVSSINTNWLTAKTQDNKLCGLLTYNAELAVTCLDFLYQELISQNLLIVNKPSHRALNFAFMGDSRIRQQFFSFLRLIPDYDHKTQPDSLPYFIHKDMDFTSDLLRLRVSFKWRPLIDENVIDTIRQWIDSNPSKRPDWILLGMEVHHMLKSYGANYKQYILSLSELGQVLGQFANVSQVIWLNQYPTIDSGAQWDIFTEKIHRYNKGVRSSLKKYSKIQIWDSSSYFAEEYIRSCSVNSLRDMHGEYYAKYFTCKDHIHTGNAALSQATQLLFNEICNAKMQKYLFNIIS